MRATLRKSLFAFVVRYSGPFRCPEKCGGTIPPIDGCVQTECEDPEWQNGSDVLMANQVHLIAEPAV